MDKHDLKITQVKGDDAKGYHNSLLNFIQDAFLPKDWNAGAVSPDYIPYQTYDSIQALCSSISGLLASRAILSGFGVGDANATATNALLIQVTQETIGRIVTIMFSWKMASRLDSDAKRWRFAADIFNDTALLFDLLTLHLPKTWFVPTTCVATAMRSLTGIAGQSSRQGITAHFAQKDNIADVSAKDSAQETVVSLMGILSGTWIITHLTTPIEIWSAFIFFTVLHLWSNYRAVKSVIIPTLNDQRIDIFCSLKTDISRSHVSRLENILSWKHKYPITLGALLPSNYPDNNIRPISLSSSLYMLFPNVNSKGSILSIDIVLHQFSKPADHVQAYLHAHYLISQGTISEYTDETWSERWHQYLDLFNQHGWIIEKSCLATLPYRYDWKLPSKRI